MARGPPTGPLAFLDGALNTPSLGLALRLCVLETGPERPGDGDGDPPMPDPRCMCAKETIGEANSSAGWDGEAKSTLWPKKRDTPSEGGVRGVSGVCGSDEGADVTGV